MLIFHITTDVALYQLGVFSTVICEQMRMGDDATISKCDVKVQGS